MEEEIRSLRQELKCAKRKIDYLTKKSALRDEISPAMLRSKLKEIFGEENPLTQLILTQMRRYSYTKGNGIPWYSPEEKEMVFNIYDSVGRTGYK